MRADETPVTGTSTLLALDELTIAYNDGAITAVDGVTLHVPSSQVLGLLGGNGAGKTSTMKAIAGVLPPTSGTLHIDGLNLGDAREADRARSLLGYCPDTGGLIRQATVREHVAVVLSLRSEHNQWVDALDLVHEFGLSEVLDRPTSGFSHGMSRRLSVLLAALSAEKVLILDEPFDGVDPTGVSATEAVISRAVAAGLAVVVSTHLLPLLVGVSDRIAVMVAGNIVDDSPSSTYTGKAGQARYAKLLTR